MENILEKLYKKRNTIILIKSEDRISRVVFDKDKDYISSYYLGKIQTVLGKDFYRLRRNVLINKSKIKALSFDQKSLMMSNGQIIFPRHKTRKKHFKQLNLIK